MQNFQGSGKNFLHSTGRVEPSFDQTWNNFKIAIKNTQCRTLNLILNKFIQVALKHRLNAQCLQCRRCLIMNGYQRKLRLETFFLISMELQYIITVIFLGLQTSLMKKMKYCKSMSRFQVFCTGTIGITATLQFRVITKQIIYLKLHCLVRPWNYYNSVCQHNTR